MKHYNIIKGVDYIGVGVGAVIINSEDEILLVKRLKDPEKGFWTIPGGSVEFGETIENAIVREVEEEIGVKVRIVTLLGITNHIIKEEKRHWVSPAFLTKIISGEPGNKEPHSHEEMRWFPLNCIPGNSTITTKAAIEFYKSYKSK